MKINVSRWDNQRHVFAPVEGGPIIPTNASSGRATGKDMQIVRVKLSYWPSEGEWTTTYLTVFGNIIKQDGTPGKEEHMRTFGLDDADAPQWVKEVTEYFRPKEPAPTAPDSLEISV